MQKKIAVIGAGGRTGTMFAFELRNVANVVGIGNNIEHIQRKELFVKRANTSPILFEVKTIPDIQFLKSGFLPEVIFLTTKNPVAKVVRYYYQKIKEYNLAHGKSYFPTLILSQNGIAAGENATLVLKEIFSKDFNKIRIIRLVLLNPIDNKKIDDKHHIVYSLPIRVGLSKISGPGDIKDIISLFLNANFRTRVFPSERSKSMELSKLFLNLIGIASATRGFSIEKGFQDSEVVEEEIKALKEYIGVVKARGETFIDLFYPINFLAKILYILPVGIFLLFRNYFLGLISKKRRGKAKDLSEIEYYNGAVVAIGEEIGMATPINRAILTRKS